jgi:hypothetical protein
VIPEEEEEVPMCVLSELTRGLIDRSQRGEVASGGGTYRERCVLVLIDRAVGKAVTGRVEERAQWRTQPIADWRLGQLGVRSRAGGSGERGVGLSLGSWLCMASVGTVER